MGRDLSCIDPRLIDEARQQIVVMAKTRSDMEEIAASTVGVIAESRELILRVEFMLLRR